MQPTSMFRALGNSASNTRSASSRSFGNTSRPSMFSAHGHGRPLWPLSVNPTASSTRSETPWSRPAAIIGRTQSSPRAGNVERATVKTSAEARAEARLKVDRRSGNFRKVDVRSPGEPAVPHESVANSKTVGHNVDP